MDPNPNQPIFVGTTELPYPEGNHPGRMVYDDIEEAKRQGRWTLSGMADDHVFFSAVLLQAAGMLKDPIAVYWAEQSLAPQEAPYALSLSKSVLTGLQDPFDHTLFACPKIHATGLFRFLDRVSVDSNGEVYDSLHQKLQVVDWDLVNLLTHVPNTPPTVDLHVWGLASKTTLYYFKPPVNPWKQQISLVTRKRPDPAKPKRRPFSS